MQTTFTLQPASARNATLIIVRPPLLLFRSCCFDFLTDKLPKAPHGIGNVGPLALDLLIASWHSSPVQPTPVLSQYLPPMFCTDAAVPAPAPTITTRNSALEIIELTPKVAILQQRTPPLRGHSGRFAAELVHWIASDAGFTNVILLTSFDSFKRSDAQIQDGGLIRVFASTSGMDAAHSLSRDAGVKFLEPFARDEEMKGKKFPVESGLTEKIFDGLSEAGVSILGISCFAPENGFHFQQALELAKAVNSALSLGIKGDWKLPYSWQDVAMSASAASALYT
ncbi:Proteasome assembly chaperone 2 [Entophlyctis luteolus]|nr:Proteasome assembly chaperone 2 [Entophlyctis luteolus]